ncbi:MAG: UvrD-helicase domain-containing protein [Ignavibacteriales bacterium]|nr:UvrD-helicase domain-containing protein [Ignavibacteriales bacterium]
MNQLTDYQKAALAYDKHISLTANAGSGKTTVLSKRFVEILVNESISINNIVAITFTEKAASELYSKIAKELDQRIVESVGNKKRKLESLRRSLVSSKISTIHSFCIDILKDYSPEAGIDANFSPIDARTSDEILNQCIDETITNNLNFDSDSVKNLIRIFGNKSQLISKAKQLFNKRKSTQKLLNEIYDKDVDEIANWFQINFENNFVELFETLIKDLIKNIELINKIAEDYKISEKQIEITRLLNEINSRSDLLEKFILLSELKDQLTTNKGEVYKKGYLSAELYESNYEIIEKIKNQFIEISDINITNDYEKLNYTLANFGKDITTFYKEINEKYILKKHQKSYLDFEDLLLLTQELLQKQEVKDELSEKYKYIMIDEYQDTNETQYNIFMPILKNLKTGNLFVVGDEKQSIYMFREAEVELFQQTKKEIETVETKASILDLPHSFRLAPNIALFTNVIFKKLFESPNVKFNEVEYNNLICSYSKDFKGEINFLIADEDQILESELVAKKIIQIVRSNEKSYNFGDITILCNKRKSFTELENEFTKKNIPFSIVGGKGFFQQQLIFDIYNYLTFLLNPHNDLALVNILRAPFYNLSDTQLFNLSQSDEKYFIDKLNDKDEYVKILEMLNRHIFAAKNLRPNEIIRQITNDTGYWSYISSKENGKQEIANLEKLIQKSIYLFEQGFHTLYDITIYLRDAINNLEDEGQAEIDLGENSVKIMTIHQSKGLEFKVVILYNSNQKPFDETLKAKEITIDKNFGILSKLPFGNNFFEDYQQAPIVGIYNYYQKKKSNAELKRLLYVAVTRAEEHLIISSELKNSRIQNGSFFEMITSALQANYDDEKIKIQDKITFMKFLEDKYSLVDEYLEYEINIEKYIQVDEDIKKSEKPLAENYKFYLNEISSFEKNEIISASKISLYLNCPRKYELTYEFGYGELTKLFTDQNDFEFNEKESKINDDEKIPSNIIGSAAHYILQKNTSLINIEDEIKSYLNKKEEIILFSENQKIKLIEELKELIQNFYHSRTFKAINEHKTFFNEIEYYKKENNYYLYGIIDKLILDKDKVIIIDYKSDQITKQNYYEKKETYLNQLLFYAFILLNEYPEIQKFQLWLVFLRDDSFSVIENVERKKIEDFGKVIKSAVEKIRIKDFSEIKDGCKNMKYYLLEP